MKYAIISDVHGNYPALRLVMEDALARGAQEFLFVGDYCMSAPWSSDVARVLRETEKARIVCGNEEGYLRVPEGDDGQFEISRFCKKVLSAEQREWLLNLPEHIDFRSEGMDIHMTHNSSAFIGQAEIGQFSTVQTALRYPNNTVEHGKVLQDIHNILQDDEAFQEILHTLPQGIYIFGHTHIQWYLQTEKHLFINPGSCGLPLDCVEFGAPYTLLTIENGGASVEEQRVKYDVHKLIEQAKTTTQYTEVRVWSEVIFREWLSGREKVGFFLKYVEEYAQKIGDERRPFAKDTWEAAYEAWRAEQEMNQHIFCNS